MKNYPTLTKMGVLHPKQIDSYSVNSVGYTDVLRIVYERPKGSILPQTRTYKFPRVQKAVQNNKGKSGAAAVMESNPALRAAIEELKNLLEKKEKAQNIASEIIEELRLLEEDIALRSEYIRTLVSKI
ncbi:MAG: DUF3461 family protein [Woeseiaceae bacterium]